MGCTASTMPLYPVDADTQPEGFPAITYMDVGVTVLSVPRGMHVGVMQLDIWSTTNAFEVEQIYDRIQTLINFKDSTTQTVTGGTLWWVRENGARDLHTPSRRIWRKSMDLKLWQSKTDSS